MLCRNRYLMNIYLLLKKVIDFTIKTISMHFSVKVNSIFLKPLLRNTTLGHMLYNIFSEAYAYK